MVVVDTSAWVEWLTDSPLAEKVAPYLERLDEVVVPTLVQYELYKWAARERDEAAALTIVGFTAQARVEPLDTTRAIAAAETAVQHRLPMADAIVYACAQAHDARLVTSDAHFQNLPSVEYLGKPARKPRT
ncbi:MAG: type II toxin-antitoxin system VapC family toxin [Burkholderiales bacterium]|nr:type II toxin-antitoxin system VapC family toxin [Burkholderiales bacterium]